MERIGMLRRAARRRRPWWSQLGHAFVGIACIIPVIFLLMTDSAAGGEGKRPLPLSAVRVPEPPNLDEFVHNRKTAVRLGKALFWDMQVGSDGIQACASCHFHAGADSRFKNQLHPGLDGTFQLGGPNYTLRPADFPFHLLADPKNRHSAALRDVNDPVSSMGVLFAEFLKVRFGFPADAGRPLADPVFNVGGVNTRRTEPRNSPTVIGAVFNATNFLDGRADFCFNGVNPFGPLDPDSGIFENGGRSLVKQIVRIPFSSLASQATTPCPS